MHKINYEMGGDESAGHGWVKFRNLGDHFLKNLYGNRREGYSIDKAKVFRFLKLHGSDLVLVHVCEWACQLLVQQRRLKLVLMTFYLTKPQS